MSSTRTPVQSRRRRLAWLVVLGYVLVLAPIVGLGVARLRAQRRSEREAVRLAQSHWPAQSWRAATCARERSLPTVQIEGQQVSLRDGLVVPRVWFRLPVPNGAAKAPLATGGFSLDPPALVAALGQQSWLPHLFELTTARIEEGRVVLEGGTAMGPVKYNASLSASLRVVPPNLVVFDVGTVELRTPGSRQALPDDDPAATAFRGLLRNDLSLATDAIVPRLVCDAVAVQPGQVQVMVHLEDPFGR